MGDACRIEQPVGHVHALDATIHRMVVRGGHDPDSHRLHIVDDRLGAARRRAVVIRIRGVDDRTFHVGVGRVRGAHYRGQCLKARVVQLTHRAADDDVPDRREGEGLGDFHRQLLGRIAPRQRQRDVTFQRALPAGERNARHRQGGKDHPRGSDLLILGATSRCDSSHGKLLLILILDHVAVTPNRRFVGCAKSPGHDGATGTASPAILRTRSAAHVIIAPCRDRGANQRPAACAKSPFDAVPAASISQGDFAHPTCSDLTEIWSNFAPLGAPCRRSASLICIPRLLIVHHAGLLETLTDRNPFELPPYL